MSQPTGNSIDVFQIIEKYYKKDSDLYNILVDHSRDVANKAIEIAKSHPEFNMNLVFLEEAAMLHDIGINLTYAPSIHCFGVLPYICHGYLGREILDNENLPMHALVCERHTGVGLTAEDIKATSLPLPHRDMIPETIEEQVICFSDCFFSKSDLGKEKSPKEIRKEMARYISERGMKLFDHWCNIFL